MGTMSASDAAPLPRLGEVFFDVRGNSRSMRLSWYADTGVAVLSIWQGGMCTGTFRLAIDDLPRLVETLQRGPAGRQAGWDSEASGQALADPPMESTAQVQSMEPLPGQGQPDLQAEPVDYLAGPREYRAGPPQYQAGPPEYQAGPPEYQAGPPRPRTEYLADLPPAGGGADAAGYGSALYAGSRRPDAPDPDTSGTAAYPHDTGGQVRYQRESADDLYRGTGSLDYRGEPPMPHYPPGTSAPSRSDALGRSAADYPAHYGTAVTDDIGHEPPQDSFPYGRPPGSRGAPSRHADPDASSG
jgi:hypothetical protein